MRKFVDYSGKEVAIMHSVTKKFLTIGDEIKSFRGNRDVILHVEPPHKPSSSGRINNYYAGVYDLEFVRVECSEDGVKREAGSCSKNNRCKYPNCLVPCKQYPLYEGQDYWTINNYDVVWSVWDDVSEEIHDENPDKVYYLVREDACDALIKKLKKEFNV